MPRRIRKKTKYKTARKAWSNIASKGTKAKGWTPHHTATYWVWTK